MGAQYQPGAVIALGQIKRIVHLPRRMLGWNIERREIVKIVLDVGAFGDGKPHLAKYGDAFLHRLAHRMDTPHRPWPNGQRHIAGLTGQPGFQRHRLEVELARRDRRRHLIFDLVERLSGSFSGVAIEAAQAFHLFGHAALTAEHRHAHSFQRIEAICRGYFGQ